MAGALASVLVRVREYLLEENPIRWSKEAKYPFGPLSGPKYVGKAGFQSDEYVYEDVMGDTGKNLTGVKTCQYRVGQNLTSVMLVSPFSG
ncbi:hypothetical protein llap_10389 [Limosa lapponica baueri]|uniref:Uncharacterized protein n=1 Tax=Limosa lapponica baueri TaxID=1758121 RepID=A0A2I0TZP8_LIMLA|nr:hypothetical protein llap_10389 [Limosa lapponica baueri]